MADGNGSAGRDLLLEIITKLNALDAKFTERFDGVDARLAEMNGSLQETAKGIEGLLTTTKTQRVRNEKVKADIADLDARVSALENK